MASPKTRRHHLGPEITGFLQRTKMAQSRFGTLVSNSPRLVHDIRIEGRAVGDRLAKQIESFMETYGK